MIRTGPSAGVPGPDLCIAAGPGRGWVVVGYEGSFNIISGGLEACVVCLSGRPTWEGTKEAG